MPVEDSGHCAHGRMPRECDHPTCPHWNHGLKVARWPTRGEWLFPERREQHRDKRFDQADSTRLFNTASYWLLYIGAELVCEVPNCEVP